MSKVKLYVHTSTIVYDKFFQQEMESVGLRPATTAEKMEAHPKCGECRHLEGVDNRYEINPAIKVYMVCRSEFSEQEGKIVYDTDQHYCCHWEGKE